MRNPCRSLALAAVVWATVGAVSGEAQTLIVSNAPQGDPVEIVLNNAPIGSATADEAGYATFPVDLMTHTKKRETDVYIYVETCGNTRRVIMAERGQPPSPAPTDCDRRDLGLFLLRRVSTVVVNVGGANPTILLVQGRFDPRDPRPIRPWNAAPTGPVLTAGGGLMRFGDVQSVACGDVRDCEGGGFRGGYTAGGTYWLWPFLGAEVTFVKPAKANVSGAGNGFEFTSTLDARVATLSGKIAAPVGPLRVYGKAGTTFQQATFTTSQTIQDRSVTVDGVTRTIPGGTQTYELKTEGWGWLFGGGMEVWLRRRLGAYIEADLLKLKGSPVDDAEGELSENVFSIVIGARLHIGR